MGRRKNGSNHDLAVDAAGTPLAATLTGANRHDVTQLIPLVDAIPAVAGKPGAPLRKPKEVMGDRGYDSDPHRMKLSGRGIATAIARRGEPHGSGLGIFRYVVEQTLALLHQFRRLPSDRTAHRTARRKDASAWPLTVPADTPTLGSHAPPPPPSAAEFRERLVGFVSAVDLME